MMIFSVLIVPRRYAVINLGLETHAFGKTYSSRIVTLWWIARELQVDGSDSASPLRAGALGPVTRALLREKGSL